MKLRRILGGVLIFASLTLSAMGLAGVGTAGWATRSCCRVRQDAAGTWQVEHLSFRRPGVNPGLVMGGLAAGSAGAATLYSLRDKES